MEIFANLFFEILPLYIIMAIGYATGKYFKVDTKSIATVAIFVVSPIVFLLTVSKMEFTASAVLAPVIVLGIASLIAFAVLRAARFYPDEKTPYLAALMAGTSNWGYFGVPIAFSLFDPSQVAIYVVIGFGTMIFENSFGIYFISRGHNSPIESFKNIFRFPVLYAIIVGLFLSYFDYQIPLIGDKFFDYFKGAYVVLGMMMIGLGLADMERFTIDRGFLATVFAVRFLIWPLAALVFVGMDKNVLGIMDPSFYAPFLLFSLMPMAANNIAFAAKFDMGPGRASVAALASTLFAMVYIPFAIWVLGLAG
jgi:predicted permease